MKVLRSVSTCAFRVACRPPAAAAVVVACFISGCASLLTSELTLSDGRKVVQPRVTIATADHAKRVCEAFYQDAGTPLSPNTVRNRKQCTDDSWRNARSDGGPPTCERTVAAQMGSKRDANQYRQNVAQCRSQQTRAFEEGLAGYAQFLLFDRAKTAADWELFLLKYSGNDDPLRLRAEAKKRLAADCATPPPEEARSTAPQQAWLNRFELVAPEHCEAQVAAMRARLRGDELAHQMAAVQRVQTAQDMDKLLARWRTGMLPEAAVLAQTRRTQLRDALHASQLAEVQTWQQVDRFLSAAGTDVGAATAAQAQGIRAASRAQVLAGAGFAAVWELAKTGDKAARQRAVALASSPLEKEVLESDATGTDLQDLRDALAGQRVRYAERIVKLMGVAVPEDLQRQFQALLWAQGPFDLVFPLAQAGNRQALRRAFDVAAPGQEQREVENKIVQDLRDKLVVYNIALQGDGRVSSSDVDAFVARRIEATVVSPLRHELRLNTEIFRPQNDYRVTVLITLTVHGVVNGERACGFMMMSTCAINDKPDSHEYTAVVAGTVGPGNSFRTRGDTELRWRSVSGGSGLASGSYFGGTRVFKAQRLELNARLSSVALDAQ